MDEIKKIDIVDSFNHVEESTKDKIHCIMMNFYYKDASHNVDGSLGRVEMSPKELRDCLAYMVRNCNV